MALELFETERGTAFAEGQDLVRRISAGDRDAIGVVYDRYGAGMYRLLAAMLGSRADAEDALHNVFLMLTQGRANRARDLKAYLYTAARREALQMLRRRKRETSIENPDIDSRPAQTDQIDWQEMLGALPPDQREVIALKVYEQMTFDEIARIVVASPNTVASRYRYGIAQLRAALGGE